MDIDPEKIIHGPFVIGAMGALVAAYKSMPGSTFAEKAINVGLGAMSAEYVTPAITEWLQITSKAYFGCAAFLFGMLSMSLAAAVLDGIKATKLGEIIESWLKRKG